MAHKIIDLLAQLEDFQKRLWLKKKFVVETQWCVTLDRVPEALYAEVAANEAQREEWVRLFAIDEIAGEAGKPGYSVPLTTDFLKANPGLALDTKFFAFAFAQRLIAEIEDLDAQTDGLLVHSENFQALMLLRPRYAGEVRVTYIDPPYNTGEDGFPYKDSYQRSSWFAMLRDRLTLGRSLQTRDGTLTVSIDDEELDELSMLLRQTYGEEELAKLVWDRNRKNDAKYFSVGHEYMLVYARDGEFLKTRGVTFREPKEGIEEARAYFAELRARHGSDWDAVRRDWLKWFDSIPVADPKRRLMRYSKVGPRGPYRDDGNISWPGGGGPRYLIEHPGTGLPVRVPSRGWVYPDASRFWEEYGAGRVTFGDDHTTSPRIVSFLFESDGQVMPSVFYSYAQTVAQEFDAMWGRRVFDNPKNWRDLARLIRYLGNERCVVLDYFGGSGTTAHAVVHVNAEDGQSRRYVLVETNDYFDTVLKPRVLKSVYAADWKDGKPTRKRGASHTLKYVRLESYEDALNNLVVPDRTKDQHDLLAAESEYREDYLLHYQLDAETRGSPSLLALERFATPFDYRLKIGTGSVGETREVPVDLVETFNYLLGLRVRTVDTIGGVRVVTGTSPEGERVLVLWRTVAELDAAALNAWFERQSYSTRDREFDVIYVNGDNALENLRRPDSTWKVRLTEEEFHRRMFDVRDV